MPDGLREIDPERYSLVEAYVAAHQPDVDRDQRDANRALQLLSRHEFCERMLWGACWRGRATLVGFNLGFDLSRLALSWHEGRGLYHGAFVFRLWEWQGRDHRFRPNVVARRLDNRRTLFAWGGVEGAPDDGDDHRSSDDHFLDVRTLLFALTNESHSLESGSRAFGPGYEKRQVALGELSEELLDYVREDVSATCDLAGRALREFHRHPVPLSADRAYSPAALGAAYFRRVGVRPPLERADVSPTRLAEAMAAFYGPRVEVRIRHHAVPVSLVDFQSQYSNVARLLGIWGLLAAERIATVDCTKDVEDLLDRVESKDALEPSLWPNLLGVALVRPQADVLPTCAWFAGRGDVPRVGLGPLACDRLLPYAIPDLVAAKVLTGKAPKVLSAWRLVGRGELSKLRVARLGGRVRFDPRVDDFWAACQRARAVLDQSPMATGMKTIGNGTAYGNWMRLDQRPSAGKVTVQQLDGRRERQRVERPEDPGRWTFPPFASAVTAGGRLLMAILERLLADAGAGLASANTDSVTVVATLAGGLVACPGGPKSLPDGTEAVGAISYAELDATRAQFGALGVPLRLTAENFEGDRRRLLQAVGVNGSRVVLFEEGSVGRVIVKRSEVALGDLRSPLGPGTTARFVDESAEWMVSHVLDGPAVSPGWFPLPATTELPMGTPEKVRSLGNQGSPFGFGMGARRARRAREVLGGEPVRLVAPVGSDPATARWVEVPSGRPVVLDLPDGAADHETAVHVATYGEELVRLALHPEWKMLGPDGAACKAGTRGLLRPRPVTVRAVHLVGKEGNQLEEVATGDITNPDDVLTDYGDDAWDQLVRPVGLLMGIRRAARETRMSVSGVADLLNGRAKPHRATLAVFTEAVVAWASSELALSPLRGARDPGLVLASYLASRQADEAARKTSRGLTADVITHLGANPD